jgi:microcystin-dependent protein
MSVSATQIQLLRSTVPNFRPDPNQLLPGQPAVNLDASQPGLFFTDSNGNLTKIGPCTVSSVAPNTDSPGSAGNCRGELWFDTEVQTLKVYTGNGWVDCDPSELGFTKVIVQTTPPPLDIYPNGALWWNDYNGEMYVLYEDPNGRQWVQVGAGGGGGGGAVIISDQQPDPDVTAAGALWWNDDTGSLFILFNDGGPKKLWVQIAGAGAINAGQGGSVSKIDAGTGLTTLNGQPITTQGTLLLKPATANEIGGVKPGNNIIIDPDGTINAVGDGTGTVTQIQTGIGITGGPITTTGTIGLATATSTSLGGVTPGAGTGVTGAGALFLEPATNSSIGGVIVGQGLNVTAAGVLAVDPVPPGFLPSGTVQWFAGSTSPAGWLFCNGQVLDTGTYPSLYAAIGRTFTGATVAPTQFQVPDLRGQFVRGWDNRSTGGVDSGRAFGTSQNDSFKSHTHVLKVNTGDYVANFRNVRAHVALPTFQQQTGDRYGAGDINLEDPSAQGSPAIQNTGEAETRPKNVALLPIIKI